MNIESFEHRIPFKSSGYQNIENLDEKILDKPIQSFEDENKDTIIPSVPSLQSNEPPPPPPPSDSSSSTVNNHNDSSSLELPFNEDLLSSYKPSDDYQPSPELLEIFELLKNDPLKNDEFNEKDFEFSEKDLEDFKKPFPEYKFENKSINSFLNNLNIMTEALEELSNHTLNKPAKKEVTKDYIVVVEDEEKQKEKDKNRNSVRRNEIKDEISEKMKKKEEEMLKEMNDEENEKKIEKIENEIKVKEIENEIINKKDIMEPTRVSSKVNYYRNNNENYNNENEDGEDSDDEEFFRSQRDKLKTQSTINKKNNTKPSVVIPMPPTKAGNEDKIIKQFTSPKKSEKEIEKEKILEKVIKQGSPPRPIKTNNNNNEISNTTTAKQYILFIYVYVYVYLCIELRWMMKR